MKIKTQYLLGLTLAVGVPTSYFYYGVKYRQAVNPENNVLQTIIIAGGFIMLSANIRLALRVVKRIKRK